MPAVFPVLLKDPAGTIQCMHGGAFRPAVGSTTNLMDGKAPAITKEGFPAVVTPCPGIPPAIIPCVFAAPAQSMSVRVTVDTVAFKPVTVMMPQLSVANGMPAFIPKSKSTGVLVL